MSSQASAAHGASILKKYSHPAGWDEGSSTGKPDLYGKKVLKVEEIRLGGGAFVEAAVEARANADAIKAFARSKGIPPFKLMIDQREGYAPYVCVPSKYFKDVLPILQAL